MLLSDLRRDLKDVIRHGGDPDITGINFDSRAVRPGDLFVAVSGSDRDGHEFAAAAVGGGAVALLVERRLPELEAVAQVVVPDSRRAMAAVARRFHDFPDRQLGLIGVTGTDGKTTTAALIARILDIAGLAPGLISTVDHRVGGTESANPEHQTTLSSLESQRLLAAMRDAGNQWAVLETSSHGLAHGRVAGFAFDVAAFTRITSEHLDYHGTVEAYVAAKAGLLDLVAASSGERPKWVVLPAADDNFAYLRERAGLLPVLTYGREAGADVRAFDTTASMDGISFRAETPWGADGFESPLVGEFNLENCLAAIAVAGALGVSLDDCARGLTSFHGVTGRMQVVDCGQPFTVIVDYAHTAEALAEVLRLLGEYSAGEVSVVFGSAGERNRDKRPAMGAVAARRAAYFVIADEDPRGESSDRIAADIRAGALAERPDAAYAVIHDRREAIRHALARARPGDTVLLAGKGHENSIIGRSGETDWDETAVARQTLSSLGYPSFDAADDE